MTDLHCHILPGMDDGAKSVDVALNLLQAEAADGVRNIAFTSHFNVERTTIEAFVEKRQRAFEQLQAALPESLKALRFKLGAEVFFSPALCDMDVEPLCITDTNYLLIEFPINHRPHFIKETFYKLQSRGIAPLIAHVERYPYVMHNPLLLYDWVAAGAYAQANAGSVLKNNKDTALLFKLFHWDLVHVLSTDTHSPDKRPPKMTEAMRVLERKLGADAVRQLKENSTDIFNNRELYTGEPHYPKKFLNWWM